MIILDDVLVQRVWLRCKTESPLKVSGEEHTKEKHRHDHT